MTFYTFKDVASGAEHMLEFSMERVPSIGSTVTRGGKTLKRLVDYTQPPKISGNAYTSYQHRRGSTEAEGADGYDAAGRPMFKSRRSAEEFSKRKSGEGIVDMTFDE